MGITQHSHGTDNVLAVATWPCSPATSASAGAGVNPLRGQNNVQGACDMGALPNVFTGLPEGRRRGGAAQVRGAWGVDLPASPA